ncbi:hypothetical protein ABBQ38_003584 [Trebouxia sp. C0009 RCD-2024]
MVAIAALTLSASAGFREGNQPSIITAAAGMLGWLLATTSYGRKLERVQADTVVPALLPMLQSLSALAQHYSCYDAIQAARIPNTLLQLVTASSTDCLHCNQVQEALTECLLSLCCQPLLAGRVCKTPEALTICANRWVLRFVLHEKGGTEFAMGEGWSIRAGIRHRLWEGEGGSTQV